MSQIPFSPPDLTEAEIDAVVEVLRSGWITTGPQTAAFEDDLAAWCGTARAVALNSATAALELALRALGVGPGDEVITTAYTYTASASVIHHTGARIVLVDTEPGTADMSLSAVEAAITPRTRAVIGVDLGGVVFDHLGLRELAASRAGDFTPASELQEAIGRIAVIADGAHSFGATTAAGASGALADLTAFSFHAVKNLTTGEGGALTWRRDLPVDHDELYRRIRRSSLHGQTKDALAKTSAGAWEYDIVEPGYKANMTDLAAAIGRVQLTRYPAMLDRRHEIVRTYDAILGDLAPSRPHVGEAWRSSAHLHMLDLPVPGPSERNTLIQELAEQGISTNVHYKPLPLLTAYRELGFRAEDVPHAVRAYERELTLPLYSTLSLEDAARVAEAVRDRLTSGGRA